MTTYYAIGDVHGMDDMLGALLDAIRADIAERGAASQIICTGDYVDRGPQSAYVVERLRVMEMSGEIICLLGNHEDMMLQACRNRRRHDIEHWLDNGGSRALASYGGGFDDIPEDHLVWLEGLPYVFKDETQKICFVHAGVEPDAFPQISREVALWTRARRFFGVKGWKGTQLANWMVVHGHTPTLASVEAWSEGPRVNVDTGACFPGGRLTCARIGPKRQVDYLSTGEDLEPRWDTPTQAHSL
jgi:Calcineurin-like phosphoesterase